MDSISTALAALLDPLTGKPFQFAVPPSIQPLESGAFSVDLKVGYPIGDPTYITAYITESLAMDVRVTVQSKIASHVVQNGLKTVPNIKNIIAVGSGKGGVGKSTLCTNIALALSQAGAKVGILDADIYGPSQPKLLGLQGEAAASHEKRLIPLKAQGIQMISIGLLVPPDSPMVWRGPMVSRALEQLLFDTAWEALDYLLVDLPPGTGDIQLTLAQKIPVSGALVVTTPQELAVLDVIKAIEMFRKVNIPVLGLVENMSSYQCAHCGTEAAVFGTGGGESLAEKYQVPLLGKVPLFNPTSEGSDHTPLYSDIALKLAAQLAMQAKNLSHAFSKIVTQS